MGQLFTFSRGKRSIAIDLKQARGVEVVLKLAETADLVLENFKVC